MKKTTILTIVLLLTVSLVGCNKINSFTKNKMNPTKQEQLPLKEPPSVSTSYFGYFYNFMEKALHGEIGEFFTFREGNLHRFQVGDIGWLLAAANDAPHFEDKTVGGMTIRHRNGVPVSEISLDEIFCGWVKKFMVWLIVYDVTEDLIDELNDLLSEVRYIHVLSVSKKGDPYWQNNVADMSKSSTPPEVAAYAFSHHLAAGGLDGLKRCELSDCKKFFVGRPNTKWCSKSCGGKHRVRKKRKRDLA